MAFAEVVKQVQMSDDCSICQLPFNDARILNCGHEFCMVCIGKWIVNSPVNKAPSHDIGIDCPVCRQVTKPPSKHTVPSSWANFLPKSEKRMTAEEENGPAIKLEGSTFPCNPCQTDSKTVQAVIFCTDCQEYLCSDCLSSHKKLKITKGHTTMAIGAGAEISSEILELKQLVHCDQHQDKQYEIYCHDHEELVCTTCAFIGHRHCTNVVEIENDKSVMSKSLSTFLTVENTRQLQEYFSDVIKSQKDYETMLDQDLKELPVELKKFREMMNSKLDKFESKILQDGRKMHAVLHEEVKSEREKCEGIECRLKALLKIAIKLRQLERSSKRHFVLSRALQRERELIKTDLYKNDKVRLLDEFRQIKLQMNESLIAPLRQETTFGDVISSKRKLKNVPVVPNESTALQKSSIVHIKELKPSFKKTKHSQAVNCQFLNDTTVAVSDKKKVLYTVDIDKNVDSVLVKLKYSAWGMAYHKTWSRIVMSHTSDKRITVYSADSYFHFLHEIKTRKECFGLAIYKDDLLVSMCENLSDWSLCRMNLEGDVLQERDTDATGRKFQSLWYFAVDGCHVYQGCSDTDQVYKFDFESGNSCFQYASSNLKGVAGLALDTEQNVYICGMVSRNIHLISKTGDAIKVFQLSSVPLYIACCPTGEYLVIGDNKHLSVPKVYKLQI